MMPAIIDCRNMSSIQRRRTARLIHKMSAYEKKADCSTGITADLETKMANGIA